MMINANPGLAIRVASAHQCLAQQPNGRQFLVLI